MVKLRPDLHLQYLVRKGVSYAKKTGGDISRAHCIVVKFQSRKILV